MPSHGDATTPEMPHRHAQRFQVIDQTRATRRPIAGELRRSTQKRSYRCAARSGRANLDPSPGLV